MNMIPYKPDLGMSEYHRPAPVRDWHDELIWQLGDEVYLMGAEGEVFDPPLFGYISAIDLQDHTALFGYISAIDLQDHTVPYRVSIPKDPGDYPTHWWVHPSLIEIGECEIPL